MKYTFNDSAKQRSPTFSGSSVVPHMMGISLLQRLSSSVVSVVKLALFLLVLHSTDFCLFLLNLVTPRKLQYTVTPRAFSASRPPPFAQRPFVWILCFVARMMGEKRLTAWTEWKGVGFRGDWGDARRPAGVSRSPCAALNACANLGILPNSGRHITPMQLSAAIANTYSKVALFPFSSPSLLTLVLFPDLAPTLAIQLVSPFEPLWRDRGWLDLEDIACHNLVEHDGSFSREDVSSPWAKATISATQGTPSERLLDLYFPEDEEEELTLLSHGKIQRHVRATARAHNPSFTFSPIQHAFAAGNSALTQLCLGGKIYRLRAWFGADEGKHERLLDGWESEAKEAFGVTILQAQIGTAIVELAAGPLDGTPRFKRYADGVEAQEGWNAMLGEAGKKSA